MNKTSAYLIILLFCIISRVYAQDSQDFVQNWLNSFGDLSTANNTGLSIFPILEISSGGQRSNMANAYTALAGDISFFESNPAASSLLPYTELAFLHSNPISDVNLESLYFSQRVNKIGYGFGLKFLHFEFTSLDSLGNQLASAVPAELLLSANVAYNLFEGHDFSGLAMGLNVKFAYKSVPEELYRHIGGVAPQDIANIIFDFGLLMQFNFLKTYAGRDKNFSIGFSMLNFGPPVNGYSLPSEFRLGLAYKFLSFFTISFDGNYAINLVNVEESEGLGLSTGLDIRFVEFFGIQFGFEFRGGNPLVAFGSDLYIDPIRIHFNYNLDLSTALNTLSNFAISLSVNFGDEGRAELQRQVDGLYSEALIALSEFDYERAIELCNEIIDPETGLNPDFTPARETRAIAERSLFHREEFNRFEREPSTR